MIYNTCASEATREVLALAPACKVKADANSYATIESLPCYEMSGLITAPADSLNTFDAKLQYAVYRPPF